MFPKSAREDSQDFIQHLALENNHGIGLMFSLYELCQTLCDKLTGILPRENVTRWDHSRSTRAIHFLTKTKFLSIKETRQRQSKRSSGLTCGSHRVHGARRNQKTIPVAGISGARRRMRPLH